MPDRPTGRVGDGAPAGTSKEQSVELTDHLRAVRRYWWITVLTLLATVGAGVYLTSRATPVYESTVTFYVAASTDTGTALQADEFAQRRVNSYVGVLRSDLVAEEIARAADLGLTAAQVKSRITAAVDPETIILTATVTDTVPERALRISEEIAEHFGPLISRLDSTDGASGANVSLTVISGPSLDPEPISPRKTLNVGVAVLAGLALGVALSIARQMLDRSVRDVDDLKEVSGLPTLATVGAEGRQRRGTGPSLLIADTEPGSPRAEAYRQLRTNLTFSAVTHTMQVVVVTSAVAGEGKTTTACNLAITLAQSGRSVLLVEADMRRPMVAEQLGIEGSAGLTNVLTGAVSAEDVIQTWGADGLHVLAAGTLPPNPSELLGSDAMHRLVDHLRDRYELVVLDTPPVLPVTDASVVAAHADTVVLVVRHGRTTREQVRAALDALSGVGAPVVGTILNGMPSTLAGDGYGYTSDAPNRSRQVERNHRHRHRGRAAARDERAPHVDAGEVRPSTAADRAPAPTARTAPEPATATWTPAGTADLRTARAAHPHTIMRSQPTGSDAVATGTERPEQRSPGSSTDEAGPDGSRTDETRTDVRGADGPGAGEATTGASAGGSPTVGAPDVTAPAPSDPVQAEPVQADPGAGLLGGGDERRGAVEADAPAPSPHAAASDTGPRADDTGLPDAGLPDAGVPVAGGRVPAQR